MTYIIRVIKGIRHKALRTYWKTGRAGRLNADWLPRLARRLDLLNAAACPEDMDLPGFRFHALGGDKKGRYAVNISANWRLTFGWDGEHAIDVDLEDYH